jgi:apolipoprotein N-acyltransferase
MLLERPQTCRFAPGPPRGMRKLGSGPAFSHEPVHDLCKVIKKPVLAIYGVAKPAQATSLGLGFAPCSSPKHAFSSLLTKIVNRLLALARDGLPGFSRWSPRYFWKDAALLIACGVLHSLAFVHTSWFALSLLTVAVLVWRLQAHGPVAAGVLGWLFGTAWLSAGTWWLFVSMHQYGGLPSWMAVLAVLALSGFLSIYLGVAAALFVRWRKGSWRDVVLLAALWLLAELARGVLFTGFPWVASGYAYIDSPIATLAPWLGVYGMGAVAAAWSAALLLQLKAWREAPLVLSIGLMSLAACLFIPPNLTHDFTQASGRLTVTLLQNNVAQDEKFAIERLPTGLAWTAQQLRAARGDVVVGPETVVPLLPDQLAGLDENYWPAVLARFQQSDQAALIGIPLGDDKKGYTNSVAGISASTKSVAGGFYRYDKHHLVPFGEFIPTGFKWFTRMMNIPLGDFARGPLAAPSFVVKGERLAPHICYEDLFGEELAARFVDEALAPTILVNVSNMGWFGQTSAVPQHLNIARMRALELQRPVLRATNTGATVVINHQGVVTHALAPYTQGVLNGEVQGRVGLTPFAKWAGHFGLWPYVLLGLMGVLMSALSARRAN